MLIIPVIDLSHGLVVHAKQGLRKSYQPITSVIAATADPLTVVTSFLELYPFRIIYIADLDAIQKTGSHSELILELASQYQQCEFWLDAGIEAIKEKKSEYSADNIKFILGSENKLPEHEFTSLIKNKADLILSLDFNEQGLIENPYLLENSSLWPEQIIAMSLSQVGSNNGVDVLQLNNVLSLAANKIVYAAGGIRNTDDLLQLKSTSVKGVLLATALHNGAITKDELKVFLDE
ncbi:MAG: hypothetical protein HND53_01955 [Proteobacteria bacterium]|nr:hypothetical protein [Pseudomonadota bacterium]NOG59235.1 hypothetical protein [Pseudomonadota bacterium]